MAALAAQPFSAWLGPAVVRAQSEATSTPPATGAASPTASESPSATLSPTPTPSPAEATGAATATATDTATGAPTEPATATATATHNPTEPATATETPSPTETAAATATPSTAATDTATSTVTATAIPETTEPPVLNIGGQDVIADEILVKFLEDVSPETKAQLAASVSAQIQTEISAIGVSVLKVAGGTALQAAATLNASENVEYAEPNYVAYALVTPTDPSWGSQYGPQRIQGPSGWDISTGSSSVILAVVDTGVDLDHPDLAAKIVAGYDFVNNDNSADDDNGHGTHVAGIAAAATNNGVGIAGVSWGARIMPVKVLDANGSGSYSDVASGIIWAADNGAKVINLSLGGSGGSTALEDAVNYAYGRGALVVAAAGNSGAAGVIYPAAYDNAVAVAATDSSDNVASFSTYGPQVEVAAPGVSIYATYTGGGYATLSGTSMATPHVAGVAAILAGQSGFGAPAAIRAALQSTALDRGATGRDQYYGYGIIQLRDALLFDPGNVQPTATNTPSAPASFPFNDSFESGNFVTGWTTAVTAEGRVRVATGYPYQGNYSLLLDDATSGSAYSTAAAILTINLAGQTQVELEFWWREFNDENHPEDGVFISADSGGTWYQVLSFNNGPNSYRQEIIDLDAAAASNGISLNNQFQIKFQFRDNYSISTDGYAIDEVKVRAASTPTETPTPTSTFTPTPTSTPGSSICSNALAALSEANSTAPPSSAEYTGDEVLVKFDADASDALVSYYVDAFGGEVSGELAELGVMVLKVPAGEVEEVVADLNRLSIVEFAEPNYVARAFVTTPNDPSWSSQYGPTNMQAPAAWDLTTGSTGTTIAVIDTGVDLDHPDLAGKIVPGCDFVNSDEVAQDDNGHGTHVAGIAAAVSNNGIGIAGVSWGARIMPVKVLGANGSGSYQQVASGIIFAADSGAQVINLSLGGSSPSSVLEDAINYAASRGVIIVAAAGNSGSSTPNYPAAYSAAIAVAATDSGNNRASFSTYGDFVDIAAPGVSIYSTYLDDIYASLSGTSMAAPHVAGAAALLYGYSANLDTAAEVRTALESTALDLGSPAWDQYYGHGLVQLHAALLFDPDNATPTPTPAPTLTPTNTPVPQTYYYVRSDTCPVGVNYNWIDATVGANLNLNFDDNFASVTLPFSFVFNGQSYSQIYVSSNGFISLETSGATSYLNRAIPNTAAPNEIIAPFWDDLNPFYGGDVFALTVGAAPNRQFVVQWNQVPHYQQVGAHTFQVILNEGSSDITFQYGKMSGSFAYGNSATVGLEFAGGTAGSQYAYNTPDAVFNGMAIQFKVASGAPPPAAPPCGYTLSAAAAPSNGGSVSVDPAPNYNNGTQYRPGTIVDLTAAAASNFYRFKNWSGGASGTSNPLTFTIVADTTITANIEQATFGDVPFDHPHYRHIQALWEGGFTAGCSSSPLLYCPDTILNRAQSAVFVLRGQFGSSYAPPANTGTFADDWSKGTWAEKWAEGMWNSNFTSGCNTSPKQYCPWQDHTRTEASVFYLRIMHGTSYTPPAPTGLFADVDLNWWGAKWAEQAYRDGLLPACGTNPNGGLLFCPNDLLTRAWAAYMMVQAKGLPLPP